MEEFKAPSGKQVVINPAPFKDALALKQAIASEFARSDFKMDLDFGGKVGSLKDMEFDIAQIAKLAALVDSSEVVYKALFTCLSRCSHDKEKITEATFEPEDHRQDYYEIVLACIRVNLGPFFKGLLSKFAPILQALPTRTQTDGSQK
jgi:hypothetical protein